MYGKDDEFLEEIIINFYEEYKNKIELYNGENQLPRKGANGMRRAFYCGQADSTWDIEPSINRSEKSEYCLIKEYEKDTNQSLFQLMARFQHYHSGTRMIDFTLPEKPSYTIKNSDSL